jgi:hypothetical protein
MATFKIPNPPGDTTMLDFRSAINTLGGPAKNCRFALQIMFAGLGTNGQGHAMTNLGYNFMARDLVYLCESVEFPGRGFEYLESRHYGPGYALPYNTKYNNEFSVSIITRNDALERQMFDDWLEVINPTNIFDFNYADSYYCTLRVFQLTEEADGSNAPRRGKPKYLWEMQEAWPFQVNPQPVTWADNDVLRLNISFYYRYWKRPGRDTNAGGTPAVPSQIT